MSQQSQNETPFVVDLLTTLRNERFSPSAWAHFFCRSWDMSRLTARTHPSLARSWRRVALLLSVAALMMLCGSFVLEGAPVSLRLLPGFLLCIAWQISDLYWHLGLVRQERTGDLYPTIGIANMLTQFRGLIASFLFGRLVGGVPTSARLALLFFLVGITTDILDGLIARCTHTQSILGQVTDSEADFCLYFAITVILVQNNLLSLWLGIIMLARFILPLLAAFASYFVLVRRVHFGSTHWGRLAGSAQCLYFLVLLAPAQLGVIGRILNLPLLIVTLLLMIIAPIVQIIGNMRVVNFLEGDRKGAPLP